MDMHDTILHGDCLAMLARIPDGSVQTCVTSPPYFGLRSYLPDDAADKALELGAEVTPEEYVAHLVQVFREVRRVLRDDGTLWLNIGDSYASKWACSRRNIVGQGSPDDDTKRPNRLVGGLKEKDLIGVPWRLAFALQADGWYLRSDIIWHKPNCMPESVRDRPTKAHEYVFLLAKRERYFYDADAIREPMSADSHGDNPLQKRAKRNPNIKALRLQSATSSTLGGTVAQLGLTGRNKRDVWSIATRPYAGAHFAVMPEALVEPCILAGSRPGDLVLDPFMGSGTVGVVARRHSRHYLGVELNAEYIALAEQRIADERQPVLWTANAA